MAPGPIQRIDQVSADGSIAVGWQEADWGGWLGTVWHNGVPELITDVNGDPVSEAFAVSGDGSIIAGENFDGQYPFDGSGWRRDTNSKNSGVRAAAQLRCFATHSVRPLRRR